MSQDDFASSYDAVVVGSGPNGLAAAIRLAQEGLSVIVLEANDTVGGGCRSAELTLPGYVHDVCAAVHPLGVASPYFRQLGLERFGLKWVHPEVPLAHPFGKESCVILDRSLVETASQLGRDGKGYHDLLAPLVADCHDLAAEFLQPLLHIPARPIQLARFGWRSFRSAVGLSQRWFREEPARALMAGLAAHSFLPLDQIPSAAFGLVLAMVGHAAGWPFAAGGSQGLVDALVSLLKSLGGEIRTGCRIARTAQLPKTRVILLDLTPRQVLRLMSDRLPAFYRKRLEHFRYGPGIFKIDYALENPIPWTAEACRRAGTVHVCGGSQEVVEAEREVTQGKHPERPFVLVAQPSLFDSTRAPTGKHVAWAYCHVPAGSSVDMTGRLENQIERFAPGFRERIRARTKTACADLELKNANLIDGSITGGTADLRQLLARPVLSSAPYRMPLKGWYLCSASTPPGAGVHGMCGFHAAETAIRDCFS
jgi:phytoene dehydrogenase-like protein